MANPSLVSITIDERQIADLRKILSPRQLDNAIFGALVDTQRNVKTRISQTVRETLAVTAKRAKRAIIAPKPKGHTAVIQISREQTPAIDFENRSFKKKSPGTFSATFRKGKGKITVPFAFKAQVGGHVGYFRRKRFGGVTGWAKQRPVNAKGIANRLPIQEIFGPSVFNLFWKRELTAIGRREAEYGRQQLAKNLARKVQYQLTKGRRGS